VESISPEILGEKFFRALDLIATAAPEIGPWMVAPHPFPREGLPIDEARKNIPELVANNVAITDGEPDPDYGYHLMARNRADRSPKSVGLASSAGGRWGDRIRFEVGSLMVPSDPDTVTYPLFRAALLAIIAQWPSVWANANAYKQDYYKAPTEPGIPPNPYSRFHMPWLSYLSAPLAAGLIPPVGVPTEITPDGGILMIAAEERLDPANPDHMRRSRAIAKTMIAIAGDPKGGIVSADFNAILGLKPLH
jgi:hypothetical protein